MADLDSKATPGASFASQGPAAGLSPSSESFAHAAGRAASESQDPSGRRSNAGAGGSRLARPERPASAFEMWSEDARPRISEKKEAGAGSGGEGGGGDDVNVEEELAREWKHLDEKERDTWVKLHDERMAKYQKDKDAYSKSKAEAKAASKEAEAEADGDGDGEGEGEGEAEGDGDGEGEGEGEAEAEADETQLKTQDEDVEMGNDDTEDQEETQAAEAAEATDE